jgi:hypothetical protein
MFDREAGRMEMSPKWNIPSRLGKPPSHEMWQTHSSLVDGVSLRHALCFEGRRASMAGRRGAPLRGRGEFYARDVDPRMRDESSRGALRETPWPAGNSKLLSSILEEARHRRP